MPFTWEEVAFRMEDRAPMEIAQQLEHIMITGQAYSRAPPALLFSPCQPGSRGAIVVRPTYCNDLVQPYIYEATVTEMRCHTGFWHGRCRICQALLEWHNSCPCGLHQHDHCSSRAMTAAQDQPAPKYRLCVACWASRSPATIFVASYHEQTFSFRSLSGTIILELNHETIPHSLFWLLKLLTTAFVDQGHLQEREQSEVRRTATDGYVYSMEEFREYYGDAWQEMWRKAGYRSLHSRLVVANHALNQAEFLAWIQEAQAGNQGVQGPILRTPLHALPSGDKWLPAFFWPHEHVTIDRRVEEIGWVAVEGLRFRRPLFFREEEELKVARILCLAYHIPFFDHLRIHRHLLFFQPAAYFADPMGCYSLYSPHFHTPFMPGMVNQEETRSAMELRVQAIWGHNTMVVGARPSVTNDPHSCLAFKQVESFAIEDARDFHSWAVHHQWFPYRNQADLFIGIHRLAPPQWLFTVPRLMGYPVADSEEEEDGDWENI